MKKINILYGVIALILIAIWQLQSSYGKTSVLFYGFAENKETEINLDFPVEVNNVMVAPGQVVKEGQLLIDVTQSDLGRELNTVQYKINELEARDKVNTSNTIAQMNQLKAQIEAKKSEILSEIRQLHAKRMINKTLTKDLESIEILTTDGLDPIAIEIEGLKKELRLSTRPLTVQLDQLEKSLNSGNTHSKAQLDQLENEKKFFNSEESKLAVTAPKDGIIGNIFCKEREYIDEFATLLSFYEKQPTMIKGFVHENLILDVKVGDSIETSSYQHKDHKVVGVVIGMGSRIVEIPERLRKNPAFKIYGREVLIEIPSENHFLQKEKVVLKLIESNGASSFYNYISNNFN